MSHIDDLLKEMDSILDSKEKPLINPNFKKDQVPSEKPKEKIFEKVVIF